MNRLAKRENIWLALLCFTLCSFAFSERINSWGIILLTLFTIADKNVITKIKRTSWSPKLWPMIGFFFIYLVFFLFSSMNGKASHALVSKLSFLILPIIFFYENYFNKKNEKIILTLFSIALSIGLLYQITHSLIDHYFLASTPNLIKSLGRMQVSEYVMHPGYYSAFLMFGIIWNYYNRSIYSYFFIGLFTVGILILLSRIIILFYILFLLSIAGRFIQSSSNKLLAGAITIAASIVLLVLIYQIPALKTRIHKTVENINNTSKDKDIASATASRRIAYEHELKMIAEKPILGYGLGNATSRLREHLKNLGYKKLSRHMNTHNQYINTWMQTGILGVGILLFILLYYFRYFKKEKNQTALWLVIMISICLLTDDLLEIQANGVFFVLLLSLYMNQRKINAP